jgi:hypothetical protein
MKQTDKTKKKKERFLTKNSSTISVYQATPKKHLNSKHTEEIRDETEG